jgi:hypothetical protein
MAVAVLAVLVGAGSVLAQEVFVKQDLAAQMTPQQLEAYTARLRERVAQGLVDSGNVSFTPSDMCSNATPEITALPFAAAGTTVGQTDDYDLPADVTSPTCTAPSTCTGAGPAGSLPRGAIYTGTGTAPDFAYQIQTDLSCQLQISMDPTGAQDLSLIVYEAQCSSLLSDCVCVDDTGVGGVAEQVTLDATAGSTYYIVVDGYSTGGAPPGPSGPFTVGVTEVGQTGCQLIPVTLESLSIQ